MSYDFTFTDRLTWISWRADWRLRYREASETIRASKRQLSEMHAERRTLSGKEEERLGYRIDVLQGTLHHQRAHAHDLMVERTEANEHKAEQIAARDAAKADPEAAAA